MRVTTYCIVHRVDGLIRQLEGGFFSRVAAQDWADRNYPESAGYRGVEIVEMAARRLPEVA